MFPQTLIETVTNVLAQCRARALMLTTAESCTGGLIAALLTEIPGSSDVFLSGVVTYSNAAKIKMLGVDAALIDTHGAVSEEVAHAMAEGALSVSSASLSIAVTGIAGPGGGSAEKPVGLVHIASACAGCTTLHTRHIFTGNRSEIRMQAAAAALALIQEQIAAT